MISLLQIENFALIESLRIELGPGMTVLTGETGSGKSIVLDALSFLFGARASAEMLREGATRAVVEAELTLSPDSAVGEWLSAHGCGDPDHPGQVLVRRELSGAGRTRAQINGRLATAAELGELGALLTEFHAQGGEHALLSAAAQRDLYDELAGAVPLRRQVAAAHGRLADALRRRDALRAMEREAESRLDYLRFAVDELEGAAIMPGESDALRAEKDRLAHADAIRVGCGGAAELLVGGEGGPSASTYVARAFREIERLASLDPELAPVARQLSEAAAQLEDAAATLSAHAESVEADPERVAEIEDRLALLRRLLRKHGPTESEAMERLGQLRAELAAIEGRGAEAEALDGEIDAARAALAAACTALTQARRRHATGFEQELARVLGDLSMPSAAVTVRFDPAGEGLDVGDGRRASRDGAEHPEFLFSANAGEALLPLRRVASGGELSRVILALRSMAADAGGVPILVFDEVDSGLSGAAASRVGKRLAALGVGRQVLCVTHQAAVAAHAGAHIAVSKRESSGRTLVAVEELGQRAREVELARLLDGGADSRHGRRLAQELLDRAAS